MRRIDRKDRRGNFSCVITKMEMKNKTEAGNNANGNENNLDYQKLGFKCGLEIHQQLDTKKLFCNCSTSQSSSTKPDKIVMRRLRVSAGETGKVDIAAEHEQKKRKYFLYHYYEDTCCLTDLDEEPPMPMNKNALETAVKMAMLLKMDIVDEVQTMRKIVIDGSNTTGFQRTSLIAINGKIETSQGDVSVQTLCLEEESAQVIERNEDFDVYNLSRLGIPLIEIATGSEIKNPEHAMECAEKIGMILRSAGGIKRGIGTIRQDVNLSITGAPRVEIKGFQELKSIPKVIKYEIGRQLSALSKNEKLLGEVRKAEPDFTTSFLRPMPGADRMYPETDISPVKLEALGEESLPELIEDKAKRYSSEYGMSNELALLAAKKGIDIDSYKANYLNVKPIFIAEYFLTMPKEIKKRNNIEIAPETYEQDVLGRLNSGEISKEAVMEILVELGKGNKIDYSKYKSVSGGDLEKEIIEIVKKNPDKTQGALMGTVMAKFRGKADGKIVSQLLSKHMKK